MLIRKKKTRSDAFDQVNYNGTVFFQGRWYPYAVLCWVVHYKIFPSGWIDHKDRIRANNVITNLRNVTPTQNQQNKAGYGSYSKGVTWRDRLMNPWQAKIRVDGVRLHLGSFATEEEAAEAYRQAAMKYHGEFACPT